MEGAKYYLNNKVYGSCGIKTCIISSTAKVQMIKPMEGVELKHVLSLQQPVFKSTSLLKEQYQARQVLSLQQPRLNEQVYGRSGIKTQLSLLQSKFK
jgi:hypothetical protein